MSVISLSVDGHTLTWLERTRDPKREPVMLMRGKYGEAGFSPQRIRELEGSWRGVAGAGYYARVEQHGEGPPALAVYRFSDGSVAHMTLLELRSVLAVDKSEVFVDAGGTLHAVHLGTLSFAP